MLKKVAEASGDFSLGGKENCHGVGRLVFHWFLGVAEREIKWV